METEVLLIQRIQRIGLYFDGDAQTDRPIDLRLFGPFLYKKLKKFMR